MCRSAGFPALITTKFKRLVGLDENIEYYTIIHGMHDNPMKLSEEYNNTYTIYESTDEFYPNYDRNITFPHKFILEEKLTEKLQMIVMTKEEGTMHYSELNDINNHFLYNFTDLTPFNRAARGEAFYYNMKNLDYDEYKRQFNLF